MTDADRVADAGTDGALDGLADALRSVDTLPVGERVAVFERLNDGIARELARLDEV
ncbi:hypothetical protein [Egicoccus sp. AB-alg6-2]|uniref:hypothetical protein n=1 Tax=Egicoccus sp. AB-alg6-2 TaxID=3242692 RepID=UPI00359EBB67